MSVNTNETKSPADRPHPFLRDGEELDPTQPPQDIRAHFYRAVVPDAMIQQMIEVLEGDKTGMVEGAGVHAALLDLKKMKFLCNGIVHAYFTNDTHQLQDYMQTLGAILNVRFRQITDANIETNKSQDSGQ